MDELANLAEYAAKKFCKSNKDNGQVFIAGFARNSRMVTLGTHQDKLPI
jgi:hypothetical protein